MVLQNVEKAQIKVRMKKDNVVGKYKSAIDSMIGVVNASLLRCAATSV